MQAPQTASDMAVQALICILCMAEQEVHSQQGLLPVLLLYVEPAMQAPPASATQVPPIRV
jgi:hypothetical protein